MSVHDDWVRLLIAPALAAGAVGQVYAAQYLTVEQAQRQIFGAAAQFQRRELKLDKDLASEIGKAAGVKVRQLDVPLWEVRELGNLVGYFLVDEVYGKHEFITYAVGLEPDGRVRKIEILNYRETYGYQVREAAWRAQFAGKTAGDPLKLDDDIKNISGATLSCRHVAEGVKRLLLVYERAIRPG